jgi:hypothetical protein
MNMSKSMGMRADVRMSVRNEYEYEGEDKDGYKYEYGYGC